MTAGRPPVSGYSTGDCERLLPCGMPHVLVMQKLLHPPSMFVLDLDVHRFDGTHVMVVAIDDESSWNRDWTGRVRV